MNEEWRDAQQQYLQETSRAVESIKPAALRWALREIKRCRALEKEIRDACSKLQAHAHRCEQAMGREDYREDMGLKGCHYMDLACRTVLEILDRDNCWTCHGTGRVVPPALPCDLNDRRFIVDTCPDCGGSGYRGKKLPRTIRA
ncbi:MAG TPA: hypothetical protein PLN64_01610 [Candidatus Bipolaricaulis anaerobius]|nr:hypothetical protein [Candidatus Bipolaricaulis anaerobius]